MAATVSSRCGRRYTPRVAKKKDRSRSAKVITHVDGDDEFSIASVDPDLRRPSVELKVENVAGKPQSTSSERTIWRLFRKLF